MIWYALLDTPSHSNEGIEVDSVRTSDGFIFMDPAHGDSYLRAFRRFRHRWFCLARAEGNGYCVFRLLLSRFFSTFVSFLPETRSSLDLVGVDVWKCRGREL